MNFIIQATTRAWTSRQSWTAALWPVSVAHGLLVALRRQLYRLAYLRSVRLRVPVVVVGNVVAGGAGKTPLVMSLVRHLLAAGHKPGVVSRGYGRRSSACLEVLPHMQASQTGDEPLLVRQVTGVPVFVAARRADAAQALLIAHPDVDLIVCDDGLQHYGLQRDLNIAVFDERGVGNGWLLPAGPLREPWPQTWASAWAQRSAHTQGLTPQAVRPVDLVVRAGALPGRRDAMGVNEGAAPTPNGQAPAQRSVASAPPSFTVQRLLASEALAANGERMALNSLQGKRLTALAAIAKPDAFFGMLRACGLQLQRGIALPDHDDLQALDLNALADPAECDHVLCTQKDAVKLFARYPDLGLRLLAVPLVLEPEPGFFQACDSHLAALMKASPVPSRHGHKTA